MTVARIAKTGGFEVRVPISMEDIDIYKSKGKATFTNSDGTMVATGKIIRVSGVINQQTQSADVYYIVKALEGEKVYNGMHLNVAIETDAEKIWARMISEHSQLLSHRRSLLLAVAPFNCESIQ